MKSDIAPDQVLSCAIGKLTRVFIIGEQENGEPYYASSTGEKEWLVYASERGKEAVMHPEFIGDLV